MLKFYNFLIEYRHFISLATIVVLLSFVSSNAFAQLGRGCYVAGVLYTENVPDQGNRYFYRTPGNLASSCGFEPTGNSGNCRLYNGGNVNNNNSYTLYNDAFSNDWEEISCPIDDYVWFLLVGIAGVVIFKFKLNLIFS